MTKTYYDLLDLPHSASVEDIKRAFRREIAKYHPDKVQHLGQEFQEIAAEKAAELTRAYQTLSDAAARAEYDARLAGSASQAGAPPAAEHSASEPAASPAAAQTPTVEPSADPPPGGSSVFAHERAGVTDLIRRATLARFRQALEKEFGHCEVATVPGVEVACIPVKAGLFGKTPPRVLGRFVAQVDSAAVAETWAMAAKMKKDAQRDVCVFLMGPAVAPPGELATAIAEQRRRPLPAGGKVIMVPVNTQNWHAHVPTDAPPVVKSLLGRMKTA